MFIWCGLSTKITSAVPYITYTVNSVLSSHTQKRRPKIGFQDRLCLMQVKSIAECSKGSILQYFGPSLSYHMSLRPLFCLFLSGHLRYNKFLNLTHSLPLAASHDLSSDFPSAYVLS